MPLNVIERSYDYIFMKDTSTHCAYSIVLDANNDWIAETMHNDVTVCLGRYDSYLEAEKVVKMHDMRTLSFY